jgi:hypothetical protein
MANIAGPQPVPENDLRSRVVALLLASDGTMLGGATVVSSDKAVTTAVAARSALDKAEALAGSHPHPIGPLMLAFPQFRGSPGVRPVPLEVQAIDGELGFGILNLLVSGKDPIANPIALPSPVPSGLLGSGEIPEEGSECDVLYNEERQPNQFFLLCISGRVVGGTGLRFRIELAAGAPVSIPGAPVFKGGLLVGIVSSAPSGGFDRSALSYDFDSHAPPFVEVLSVAAMAQSEVTPAVRNLLSQRPRPLPTSARDKKFAHASGRVAQTAESAGESAKPAEASLSVGGTGAVRSATLTAVPNAQAEAAPVDLSDAELFARLSSSGRRVLERAEAMWARKAPRQDKIHMEYLVSALFESWKGFFGRAGIDKVELGKIVKRTVGTEFLWGYTVVRLDKLPPMSKHVREALLQAARYADARGAKQIWSTHLLYGALSVEDCRMIQALVEHGVKKESISAEDERGVDGRPDEPAPAPVPTEPERTGANPTPKVDSDLWSDEDRLGYEAYARTIASLITHRETKPPLTIGIRAPWGAGKTTLMRRVQHLLDGDAELTERNESGLKQMWQQSTMTFWSLLRTLNRKTIIVDPEKHEADGEPARGRARELLKEAVRVDALKPKASAAGRGYGVSPRITVWFNVWRYQTSEQVWAGMAHCMISQITARMSTRQRELFWLRLRTRRINADEVRWRVWEAVLRQVLPFALLTIAVCLLLFLAALIVGALPVMAAFPKLLVHIERSIPFAGILAIAWKTGSKLGDKAAGAVRDLVREPDYENKMGYLAVVESDIRDVLKLASVTSKQPLVVFVDDLDRCAPYKVAEVVEALNLFLCGDYPNCVFVIGMEPGMVAAALEVANKDVIEKAVEMGLADRTALVGWRFMEKIVQLPIMIPPPTEAGRLKYVNSLTGFGAVSGAGIATFILPGVSPATALTVRVFRPPQHGTEEEKKVQEYLEKIGPTENAREAASRGEDVVAQAPEEERWAAQEAGNRVYERTLSKQDSLMAGFLEEVARLVDGNPRQIKRYVNVFRFYCTLRHSLRLGGSIPREDLPSDEVLAKFAALSIQWPHAVDCLRVKKDVKVDGRKVSLLELLETESKKVTGDGADSDWEKFVGKDGLGMGAWAEKRAFREFLSRGESLCAKEGHGLW